MATKADSRNIKDRFYWGISAFRSKWGIRLQFRVADVLLNFFLLTPLIVLHYHATCLFLDCVLCQYAPTLGAFILLAAGTFVEFSAGIAQKRLACVLPERPGFEYYHIVATRLFNYVLAFANICHMKAVTDIFLLFSGNDAYSGIKAATTGILVLWGIRCGRNILGPPLSLGLDTGEYNEFYTCQTIFSVEPDGSPESMMDTGATVGVVLTFIHLHWAGVMTIMDACIFPGYPLISMLTSALIGYAICAAFLVLQHRSREISRDLEHQNEIYKIVFENAYTVLATVGVISVWRACWLLFDMMSSCFPIYYLGFDITPLAANIISYLILAVANVTNSLTYKGCEIDGSVNDGEGVVCATDYFMEFLKDFVVEEEKREVISETQLKQTGENGTPPARTKISAETQPFESKPPSGLRPRLQEDSNDPFSKGSKKHSAVNGEVGKRFKTEFTHTKSE